jgi:hypothetical protein
MIDPGVLISEVVVQIIAIIIIITMLKSSNKIVQVLIILVYPDWELLGRLLFQNVVNDPELADIHGQG